MSDPLADLSRQIEAIAKTLQGITQEGAISKRNANTLADAVVTTGECPDGLVGCNAKVLGEVTGNVLTCPPLEEAPDPIIVDHKARVCYAPESLRKQFQGKKVDLRELMDKYSAKLLALLSKQGNLATALRAAVKSTSGRVAVANVFSSNPTVAAAQTTLNILTPEQAAAYLSMFTGHVSLPGADLIDNAITQRDTTLVTWILALAVAYSNEQKRDFVDAVDTLGAVLTSMGTVNLSFLDRGFVRALGTGGSVNSFVASSMEALVVDSYATGPKSGYFVAVQANYEAYQRVGKAEEDYRRASDNEISGGGVVEDAEKALKGSKLNFVQKGIEIAKAVKKTLDPVRRASARAELIRIRDSQGEMFYGVYDYFLAALDTGGFYSRMSELSPWTDRAVALERAMARDFDRDGPSLARSLAVGTSEVGEGIGRAAAAIGRIPGQLFQGLAQGLRSRTSAGVGPRQKQLGGGSDDSEMWGGDVNDYEAMLAYLEGGFQLEGGALPSNIHTAPLVVQDAVDELHPKTDEERALKKKLALMGREITVYKTEHCPSFVNDDNNSFGTPGQRGWIETVHPWAKCQEQMGFQFQTSNGYCYPQGMSCYPQHDVKGALAKTEYEALNYQEMAKIYNSVVQEEYMSWLAAEKARIKRDNPRINETELEALAKSHTPVEYEGIPNAVAVQTMVTISRELEQKVSELTNSTDAKERQLLKDIIVKYGTMKAQWADKDLTAQARKLDAITKTFVDQAEKCTTKSVTENDKPVPSIMPGGTAGGVAGCDVLELGDQKLLIPAQIKARIDEKAIERGEPVDPLVEWWRSYYASKEDEHKKKFSKLRSRLAPEFDRGKSVLHKRVTSSEQTLESGLKNALGPGAPSV